MKQSIHIYGSSLGIHQRGMITLFVAAVLLVMITLVTLFTARTTLMDQKITANDYRMRQASEAAQAGLEYAIAAINQVRAVDLDLDSDGELDDVATLQATVFSGSPGTLDNGATYQVDSITDITPAGGIAGVFDQIRVVATGWCDDRSISRTVTQVIKYKPFLMAAPDAGLAARNDVVLSGGVSVKNEETNITVRSGGTLGTNGGSGEVCNAINDCTKTANASDPTVQNYYGVFPEDPYFSSIAQADFFSTFFGMSLEDAKASASKTFEGDLKGSELLAYLTANPDTSVVYVDGDYTQTSGVIDAGIILIVNGDAQLNGKAFSGLIYATGGFDAGNATITGAVIAESDYAIKGTVDIIYDSSKFGNPALTPGGRVRLPGTWRDW